VATGTGGWKKFRRATKECREGQEKKTLEAASKKNEGGGEKGAVKWGGKMERSPSRGKKKANDVRQGGGLLQVI